MLFRTSILTGGLVWAIWLQMRTLWVIHTLLTFTFYSVLDFSFNLHTCFLVQHLEHLFSTNNKKCHWPTIIKGNLLEGYMRWLIRSCLWIGWEEAGNQETLRTQAAGLDQLSCQGTTIGMNQVQLSPLFFVFSFFDSLLIFSSSSSFSSSFSILLC